MTTTAPQGQRDTMPERVFMSDLSGEGDLTWALDPAVCDETDWVEYRRAPTQEEGEPTMAWQQMFRAREPRPGAHLRADGSPCSYLHNGEHCNKCGFMVPVPTPPSAEVEALVRDAGQAAVSAWRNNASGLGIRHAVGRAIRSHFAGLRTKGGTP